MRIVSLNGDIAWRIITAYINEVGSFKSVTGIVYQATVSGECIMYKGGNRNGGKYENIERAEFISVFPVVQNMDVVNTSSIKRSIPSSLYRKRTPLIGLLISSGLLDD
ncbi:MAG: hypothetical protein JST49_16160 [Bacteroidetes bacterium]|nr:hypothetical protein [Bacteroidota bacterium]